MEGSNDQDCMVQEPLPKTTVTFISCGDLICRDLEKSAFRGYPCLGGHFNGKIAIGLTPQSFPNYSFTRKELD